MLILWIFCTVIGLLRTLVSVPDQYEAISASGWRILRMMRGVMAKISSVLFLLRPWLENKRPSMGISPKPGTLLALSRSSLLIKPANTCVSPSLRRSTVLTVRVLITGAWVSPAVPLPENTISPRLLTSKPVLIPTSPSMWISGSTSNLRPRSMYWMLPVTTGVPVEGVTVLVIIGYLEPIKILAFSRWRTRMRGLANVLISPSVFLRLRVMPRVGLTKICDLLIRLKLSKVCVTGFVVVIPVTGLKVSRVPPTVKDTLSG